MAPKKKKTNSKKWTTVKSRHLDDSYKDPDTVLAYTMFEILTTFLEKESGNVDWTATDHHAKAMHQMNHLAFWFNKIYVPYVNDEDKYYPNEPKAPERLLVKVGNYYELNKEGNEEYWEHVEFRSNMEENMKLRLIKNMKLLCELSPYMWS